MRVARTAATTGTTRGARCFVGLVFFLNAVLVRVQGMITVVDTGESFPSRQDKEYGPLLWKHNNYGGRLQMIEGNLPLCPPDRSHDGAGITSASSAHNGTKHQLIIPSDGLPVALLGRAGGCSVKEKLQYIQEHVQPWYLVHFLILDGADRGAVIEMEEGVKKTNNDADNDVDASSSVIRTVQGELARLEEYAQQDADDNENNDDVHKRDESIPIHVLQVSFRTEYKLLDYLLHQSKTMKQDGGPHLIIDAKINVHHISDNVVLAIAALTLLCASLCSLCLLIHGNRQGWWEPPPPQAPPRNNNRRRLRRDQVKALLPVYRFNGQELEIIPEETTFTTMSTPVLDEEGNPIDVVRPQVPPLPAELDCCSICLDDYEVGDRVRCIEPCNHTFHSKCIGKWLVERSATCPLCKHDLYDSDDEEDEEEEEAAAAAAAAAANGPRESRLTGENAGIQRFQAELPLDVLQQQEPQRSIWDWLQGRQPEQTTTTTTDGAVIAGNDEEQPQLTLLEEQQEGNNAEEGTAEQFEDENGRPLRSRRSWWQRMFRRREPAVESLTEPLLSLENEQEAAAAAPQTADDVEAPSPSNDIDDDDEPANSTVPPTPLEMGPASESAVEESVIESVESAVASQE